MQQTKNITDEKENYYLQKEAKNMGKIKGHNYYAKFFADEMAKNTVIKNSDGKTLEILEGEEFKQVYNPDVEYLREFPKYWFLSNLTGNMISAYGGRLTWLKKIKEGKTPYPLYSYMSESKRKCITIHKLQALVWGIEFFGLAQELWERDGVKAFGRLDEEGKMGIHHKYSATKYPEKRFDPKNMQGVTGGAHLVIEKIPPKNASAEQKIRFVSEMNRMTDVEAPNKVVILTDDDEKAILGLDLNDDRLKKILNNIVEVTDIYQSYYYPDGKMITIKPEKTEPTN